MDYDSAFADLNKALVDLDGDGKPDAPAPRAKLGANRLEPGEVSANQPQDESTWFQRLAAFVASGGPMGQAQPGQRGTWVPSQINDQGKAELAVPGIIQQPAESLQSLMTAPLADIVRSGDRDAIRAAAEASFDVAGALPAAGAAIGRTVPKAKQDAPLRTYHGRRDPNPDFNVMRSSDEVWSSTNPDVASDYASKFGNVQGAVVPMDTSLNNPLRVQPPRGSEYDAIPFEGGTYDLRQLAKIARERGHDGMIAQGVMDSPDLPAPPGRIGDTVVTFKKGSVKSPLTGETLFSNPDDPTTAAAAAALTAQERPKGIKAYHGSPHDFDKFDLSKIGTGEGAQVYGHGLYFAENDVVARRYRDDLSGPETVGGREFDNWRPAHWSAKALSEAGGDRANAAARLKELVNASIDDRVNSAVKRGIDLLLSDGDVPEYKKPGRMYEVSINANPEDFLDWDKPISQQSKKVKGAAQQAIGYKPDAFRGDEFVRALELERGRSAATKALREAGIPGIRYLDQGSRTAGEGSRNYVVFDDALVDILRKYSNAPDPNTAAILAILAAQQGGQQNQ